MRGGCLLKSSKQLISLINTPQPPNLARLMLSYQQGTALQRFVEIELITTFGVWKCKQYRSYKKVLPLSN